MPDLSDFPPLMQDALQTGRMPSREALARATGKNREEIDRLLDEKTADEDDETLDPDEQAFRDKYHRLVEAMIVDWHEDNPTAIRGLPADERERIEDHCHRQIQREWRRYRQRLDTAPDTDE